MIKTLSEKKYKATLGSKMTDVTASAEPVVDIWPYVENLVEIGVVSGYVLENSLVEWVYRNDLSTFEHVLLPATTENAYAVIVINLEKETIYGHFLLDLEKEYSLN